MSIPPENDRAGEPTPDSRSRSSENFCQELEAYIESNPFRSMAIALLAGIAVAKLLL